MKGVFALLNGACMGAMLVYVIVGQPVPDALVYASFMTLAIWMQLRTRQR